MSSKWVFALKGKYFIVMGYIKTINEIDFSSMIVDEFEPYISEHFPMPCTTFLIFMKVVFWTSMVMHIYIILLAWIHEYVLSIHVYDLTDV